MQNIGLSILLIIAYALPSIRGFTFSTLRGLHAPQFTFSLCDSIQEVLFDLTNAELKVHCRTLGLPVSGTKAVLVGRLLESGADFVVAEDDEGGGSEDDEDDEDGEDGEENVDFDDDAIDGLEIDLDDLLLALGDDSGEEAVGNALLSEVSKKLSDSSQEEEKIEKKVIETPESGTEMPSWRALKTALREKGIATEGAANKAVLLRRLETNGASLKEEMVAKQQHVSLKDMVGAESGKAFSARHANADPLEGVTLKRMVEALYEEYGWAELAQRVPIRCFQNNPSVKSSLTFLRRTPWARQRVEELYMVTMITMFEPE